MTNCKMDVMEAIPQMLGFSNANAAWIDSTREQSCTRYLPGSRVSNSIRVQVLPLPFLLRSCRKYPTFGGRNGGSTRFYVGPLIPTLGKSRSVSRLQVAGPTTGRVDMKKAFFDKCGIKEELWRYALCSVGF